MAWRSFSCSVCSRRLKSLYFSVQTEADPADGVKIIKRDMLMLTDNSRNYSVTRMIFELFPGIASVNLLPRGVIWESELILFWSYYHTFLNKPLQGMAPTECLPSACLPACLLACLLPCLSSLPWAPSLKLPPLSSLPWAPLLKLLHLSSLVWGLSWAPSLELSPELSLWALSWVLSLSSLLSSFLSSFLRSLLP